MSSNQLIYGFCATSFGECLIGIINGAVAHLSFVDQSQQLSLQQLHKCWPDYLLTQDQGTAQLTAESIFTHKPQQIIARGTDLQMVVWRELLTIPCGSTCSYQEIAQRIGKPTAVRAVATAIGKNNISLVIPCHRVIGKSGKLHGYRWGLERKQRILDAEKLK